MIWPINCVRATELLANHTSFRIGGPAEWFATPSDLDELVPLLREAFRRGIPVSVIGGGTNLLVADQGVQGLVVRLGRGFRTVEMLSSQEAPEAIVRCGASVLTQRLVTLACQQGWGALESLAGLPGQVGGAVVMNAQQIGQFVDRVILVTLDGQVKELTRDQLSFSYRYTAMEPGIIVQATFRFPRVPVATSLARIQQALCYRNATQEVSLPSAGCAFKNPQGASAGRLIDQAGLKGVRVGDAKVSLRHANFIVNLGQATCDDVLSLMEYVQRHVARSFGVWLEPEVRVLGARWVAEALSR